MQSTQFVKCSLLFTCNQQKYSYINDGARCKRIGRASCDTKVFFHFVLLEEQIASKAILLPCIKLILRVSYLFAFFEEMSEVLTNKIKNSFLQALHLAPHILMRDEL